jgi:hypothetical protein
MSLELEEGMGLGLLASIVIYVIYRRYLSNVSLDITDLGPVGQLVSSLVVWFANILPFTILIYGIAGDIINQTGVKLALPSIVALVSMAVIGLGTQLLGSYAGGLNLNSEETYGSFWCTIPGLERLESPYMPTAFLATSTIAFYYLTWAWSTGIPSGRLGTFFGITFVLQLSSYLVGGCAQSYASIGGPGGLLNVLVPIGLGIVLGSITAGGAIAGNKAHYNPFTPTMNGATGGSGGAGGGGGGGGDMYGSCPSGKQETASGKCVTCPSSCTVFGEKCVCDDPSIQPPPPNTPTNKPGLVAGHSQPIQGGGDENTFVAELYKNGQLVTSTLAD